MMEQEKAKKDRTFNLFVLCGSDSRSMILWLGWIAVE